MLFFAGCTERPSGDHSKGVDSAVVGNQAPVASTPAAAVHTEDRVMVISDSLVTAISSSNYDMATAFLPPDSNRDTLKSTLYFKDSIPARMDYTLFEDGGEAFGNGTLYFTEQCPVISELKYEPILTYEVLTRDGRYYWFSKSMTDGKFDLSKVPEGAIDYRKSSLIRHVADLTQLYPGYNFNIPQLTLKGDLKLKMLTEMPMYEAADTTSPKVGVVPKKASVGFLQAGSQAVTSKGRKWIWYLVSYNGQTGWINGHPAFVQEPTDENAE
jgi:hypothetical protein